MHSAKNMVGELVTSQYDVSLFRRYFRLPKHKQHGRIMKSVIGFVTALEVQVGVLLYA